MNAKPTLLDFCDDELLRAPLIFDQVVDAVLVHWRQAMPAASKQAFDAVRALARLRGGLVSDAVRELRTTVQAQIAGRVLRHKPPQSTAQHLELSLIDDDEVSVDIEVSRSVELIKAAAEYELRELQAYTSALVDDLNVSYDTNPFRPEAYVRSLRHGVAGLALSRSLQARLMRDAAEPLANSLRQGYAAACTRLQEQGLEPARHRTIVPSATMNSQVGMPGRVTETLTGLRQSMPVQDASSPAPAMPDGDDAAPRATLDLQLVDPLSRLFDAIQCDPKLTRTAATLLLRLQPSVRRVALIDPAMLETFEHPVWRFMDSLAFILAMAAATDADRCHAHCRQLVEHLLVDSGVDTAGFDWATGRLAAFDRHLLQQGVAAAQPAIERLHSAIDPAHMPIDVATLDTIPAELMPLADELPPAPPPSLTLQPGVRLRAYLQGEWRLLQVLWCDPIDDHWLLRDLRSNQLLALRRRALDRLAAEQLALALRPHSLVRAAAERLGNAAVKAGAD